MYSYMYLFICVFIYSFVYVFMCKSTSVTTHASVYHIDPYR